MSLGAIGVIGVLGLANGGSDSQTATQILAGRPECPHDWDFKSGQMAIVGSNINIPEFHDCQRFIEVQSGTRSYGALYAIFAADTLTSLDSIPPGTALATAEIYAEGDYPYLGIVQGYNCLYVSRGPRSYAAKMVPVGSPDVDCALIRPDTAPGRPLVVHPTSVAGLTWNDYPPVARWDWSDRTNKQYIGIKCGAAWCEVGDRDLPATVVPTNNLTGTKLRRTRLVKGWYDEQILAMRDNHGNTVPSQVHAMIYPDSALDDLAPGAFDAKWVQVAHVAFEGQAGAPAPAQYKASLNFDVTPAGAPMRPVSRLNTMYLCHGTPVACRVPTPAPVCDGDGEWWGLIIAATDQTRMYRCVVRRGHEHLASSIPGYHVPGTARWRWLASDERTWKACVQGCCEVQ